MISNPNIAKRPGLRWLWLIVLFAFSLIAWGSYSEPLFWVTLALSVIGTLILVVRSAIEAASTAEGGGKAGCLGLLTLPIIIITLIVSLGGHGHFSAHAESIQRVAQVDKLVAEETAQVEAAHEKSDAEYARKNAEALADHQRRLEWQRAHPADYARQLAQQRAEAARREKAAIEQQRLQAAEALRQQKAAAAEQERQAEVAANTAVSSERAHASAMLDTADALLDAATSIYNQMPHTHAEGAALVSGDQGPAGRFYARDRRFQQDLGDSQSWQDQDDRNTMLDLSVAEAALYNVVFTTVLNCDASDAEANLHVARSVINEAHLDYAGKGKDTYSPPEIDESNTDHCDS